MPQDSQYQALVSAFYQAIANPDDESLLKNAMEIAADFEESEMKQAMAEASVMSVMDKKLDA